MPETKPEQMLTDEEIEKLWNEHFWSKFDVGAGIFTETARHSVARAIESAVLSRAVPPVLSGEAWMEEAERLLTEYVSDVTAAEASAAGFDRVGLRSHMQSAEESRAALLAHLRLRAGDGAAAGQPIELAGVAEELASQSGFWRSCSGCHESNEGHPTGPYSEVFKCHLGVGCRECGGLGAVWDDTDYDAMADFMAQESHAPSAPPSCASSSAAEQPNARLLVPCELPQFAGLWMAEDGTLYKLAASPSAPAGGQAPSREYWIVSHEEVVEIPGKRPALGYTVLADAEPFPSFDAASKFIRDNGLPLGWVAARSTQAPWSALLVAPPPQQGQDSGQEQTKARGVRVEGGTSNGR